MSTKGGAEPIPTLNEVDFQSVARALRVEPQWYGVAPAARAVGLSGRVLLHAGGDGPLVTLGIIDRAGDHGRIGGAIYEVPLQVFSSAVATLDAERVSG